jgi:ferredoxin-NADP reductase
MSEGKGLLATSVMGDFMMPEDKNRTLVFIAGGIGITPFVSMLRTLLIKKEKRDIVLFYANKKEGEIAYKEVLEEARRELGVRVVYVLSDLTAIPGGWTGEKGFITQEIIETHVTAVVSSSYYISGPPNMVSAYSTLLQNMHVCKKDITTDFFPGFD